MASEKTRQLIGLLGKGEKNAVKREQLAVYMGLSDRSMREAVAMARLEGVCIANNQDGTGYYIPENLEEYKQQYRQTKNRGRSIFAQLAAIRQGIEDLDQGSFDDLIRGEV